MEDIVAIHTSFENNKPKRVQLIMKENDKSIDVILPENYLYDAGKSKLYIIREKDANYFITRIEVDK